MRQPAYAFLSGQTIDRIFNIQYPMSNIQHSIFNIGHSIFNILLSRNTMPVFLHRLGDFPSQQKQQRR